jgi:chromate transporter
MPEENQPPPPPPPQEQQQPLRVPLAVIAREWGRIGCTGFGGPPAHIALLRQLCVQRHGWLTASEFEDGIAATNLLPGPASTQLAIFCAWRLAGPAGALVGGLCFIVPGLLIILALSALFLAHTPPAWVTGAAAGAGAAVPAVAVGAAAGLAPASWQRAGAGLVRTRWVCYLIAGALAADLAGEFVVVALAGCGLAELLVRRPQAKGGAHAWLGPLAVPAVAVGGLASVAWVAFKVGALSFGGGFVIIPLMQRDAVHTYHWMTGAQFLSAVALGQVTPGPVVQTVAVVGYAAAGIGGALLASAVAFTPSFVLVLAGARHFDSFRASVRAQAFLAGAGPAAIGAIAGAAVTLGLELTHLWQVAVLAAALGWLLILRRSVVVAIVGAAGIGIVLALAGVG